MFDKWPNPLGKYYVQDDISDVLRPQSHTEDILWHEKSREIFWGKKINTFWNVSYIGDNIESSQRKEWPKLLKRKKIKHPIYKTTLSSGRTLGKFLYDIYISLALSLFLLWQINNGKGMARLTSGQCKLCP